MNDKSLAVTGAGQIAKAIPAKALTRLVETARTTFEQCLTPLTETTSGTGRLVRKAAEAFELQRGAAGKSSLIERFEGNWALSTIGEEFIRSVAGPTADAT